MKLEPFVPAAALAREVDPVTAEVAQPRPTVTREQRREAVDHALRRMAEARVWVAEVEVRFTRQDARVLTVRGHAERAGGVIVPCLDSVEERTADGRLVTESPAERYAQLERELIEDAPNGGLA